MTDHPLVSIVTPTLNQGRFIGATIRSIREQTYDRYEHVVVDGGSTDETLDILRRHEGTYTMRWLSEPDRGMYDAVNKGLRLASGDILCYLNSDDLYFPWTLETVVSYFRRHPDVDFVYGDALSIDDETGRTAPYWTPPFDLAYLRSIGFLAQPTVFWRRSAYECDGGFDESLRYVADCAYWMRAGDHHRFAKINEFLAVERDHPGSLRLATGNAVWDELAAVRARYAPVARPAVPFWVRRGAWARFYSLALLGAASRPGWPRGPWARLLRTRTLEFSRTRLVLRTLPRIGTRLAGEVFRPATWWLRRPSGEEPVETPRPAFSVVVAVFNGAATIRSCLDSVLAQSLPAWELVVIDGGSTDETPAILQAYGESLAYWESKPDRGIYHAWNKALPHCRGEWIVFLGADDRLASCEVLKRAAHALAGLGDRRIAYGSVQIVDANGTVVAVAGEPWHEARASHFLANAIPHQGVFHRRSLFERSGPFDESFRICGDYELLLRELHRSEPAFIPELVVAAMGDGGLSRRADTVLLATLEQHRARYLHGHTRVPAWLSFRILRARGYAVVHRLFGERAARRVADAYRSATVRLRG